MKDYIFLIFMISCLSLPSALASPYQGILQMETEIKLELTAIPQQSHTEALAISMLKAICLQMPQIIGSYESNIAEAFFSSSEPQHDKKTLITLQYLFDITPPPNLLGGEIPVALQLQSPQTINLHLVFTVPILGIPGQPGYPAQIQVPEISSTAIPPQVLTDLVLQMQVQFSNIHHQNDHQNAPLDPMCFHIECQEY